MRYPHHLCIRLTGEQMVTLQAVLDRLEEETLSPQSNADGIRWLLERPAVKRYAEGK
jgi:hypothetical protein